jgi:phenylacetate-CoA ligase
LRASASGLKANDRSHAVEAEAADAAALAESVRAVLTLRGEVEVVPPGSLPNDGKVIDDRRSYS